MARSPTTATTHYTDAIRVEGASLMDVTSQHASGDRRRRFGDRGQGRRGDQDRQRRGLGDRRRRHRRRRPGVLRTPSAPRASWAASTSPARRGQRRGAQSWAIYASAANGAINIDSGTATAAGAGGRAIYANGGGGVTIHERRGLDHGRAQRQQRRRRHHGADVQQDGQHRHHQRLGQHDGHQRPRHLRLDQYRRHRHRQRRGDHHRRQRPRDHGRCRRGRWSTGRRTRPAAALAR